MATAPDLMTQGNYLAQHGRFQEAATCYQQLLRLQPGHAEAHNNLGVMFAEQRQLAEAVTCYDQALALDPRYAHAHYNRANALEAQGRREEAAEGYRQALRLRPGFAEAHLNLGIALALLGDPAEAIVQYQEALRLRPDMFETHSNLGLALAHLGQHDQALPLYQRALDHLPDYAGAHFSRALTWLAQGNFAQGWAEFEWRWRLPESPPRPVSQPLWDGGPLDGKTILLHAEQGQGDTIQFIRYAPLVQQRGGRVVVECQATLISLLAGCRGIDQLVASGAPLPPFDLHCPLLSLGRIFKTDMASIPADIPYLGAEAGRVERWRRELRELGGFTIGIAWQGSLGHRWDRLRSIPLSQFAPLAGVPGVRLISLQVGAGREQLEALGGRFPVTDLGSRFDPTSFEDAAAAVMALDLVVTVDTALAHLAGALGAPVWVALSVGSEWRWLLSRAESPWYPTMRLWRQQQIGDWGEVFERMAGDLRQMIGGRSLDARTPLQEPGSDV